MIGLALFGRESLPYWPYTYFSQRPLWNLVRLNKQPEILIAKGISWTKPLAFQLGQIQSPKHSCRRRKIRNRPLLSNTNDSSWYLLCSVTFPRPGASNFCLQADGGRSTPKRRHRTYCRGQSQLMIHAGHLRTYIFVCKSCPSLACFLRRVYLLGMHIKYYRMY